MITDLRQRPRDAGVIATEYVIVLVLIALAIVGGSLLLGNTINANVSEAASAVSDSIP